MLHNALRVSLTLILFIEICILTFINILRGYVFNIVVLRSVNILFNKRICAEHVCFRRPLTKLFFSVLFQFYFSCATGLRRSTV